MARMQQIVCFCPESKKPKESHHHFIGAIQIDAPNESHHICVNCGQVYIHRVYADGTVVMKKVKDKKKISYLADTMKVVL